MWMFHSVSGHSSKISIANHSWRPTVSQLKCVSTTISNWFENNQPQKTKSPPSFMILSFKTWIKWPLGWPQPQVFQGYFSTPAIFEAMSKLFSSKGCSDNKNWLDFSSIFFKICRAKAGFRVMLKYFEINKSFMCSNLFCYYIKQLPVLALIC